MPVLINVLAFGSACYPIGGPEWEVWFFLGMVYKQSGRIMPGTEDQIIAGLRQNSGACFGEESLREAIGNLLIGQCQGENRPPLLMKAGGQIWPTIHFGVTEEASDESTHDSMGEKTFVQSILEITKWTKGSHICPGCGGKVEVKPDWHGFMPSHMSPRNGRPCLLPRLNAIVIIDKTAVHSN